MNVEKVEKKRSETLNFMLIAILKSLRFCLCCLYCIYFVAFGMNLFSYIRYAKWLYCHFDWFPFVWLCGFLHNFPFFSHSLSLASSLSMQSFKSSEPMHFQRNWIYLKFTTHRKMFSMCPCPLHSWIGFCVKFYDRHFFLNSSCCK